MAPSREDDEVKKRVGLPLGLIVALITDADNTLKINLPVSGPLDNFKANFSDAIWTVVKNVVVNIVAAPFRAIGRLFKGNDDKVESLAVEPVTFKPGTDTVADGMDQHLTKVADFMRRAPAIRLTLAPLPGAADVESLKGQELNARLQQRQREKGLKDFPAAVAAEFREKFPDVKPLPPPDDQLTRLREAEALPPERLSDLLARRVAAVRDTLTKAEGIPETRLKGTRPPRARGSARARSIACGNGIAHGHGPARAGGRSARGVPHRAVDVGGPNGPPIPRSTAPRQSPPSARGAPVPGAPLGCVRPSVMRLALVTGHELAAA